MKKIAGTCAVIVVLFWGRYCEAKVGGGSEIVRRGLIGSNEPGWPQWRGRFRDGVSDERNLLEDWGPAGPDLIWEINGLGTGWSSPVVVGGRLYITGDVGDELAVYCFDMDGRQVWRVANGRAWKGSYKGARASCVYSRGRVYNMNAHGRVACLEAESGREVWAVNVLERFASKNITWAVSECLLVDGDRVIVTPGGSGAMMAALDCETGQTSWESPPIEGDTVSYCSPILIRLGGRRIIANCSAEHGFGVDADTGRLLWTVPLKNQFGVNAATPVYGDRKVFYVTPYGELGRAYRLVDDTGGVRTDHVWSCGLDTVTGSGVLVEGVLYAGGYKKEKWWFAVDWDSGRVIDECKDITTGAAIHADGSLYCLDERGTAALVKVDSGRMEVVSSFRLVEGKVVDAWAHPVLEGGRLYLRYHDRLCCYDVGRN